MVAMFSEYPAHCQDPAARIRVPGDVPHKPDRTEDSFVANQPRRLQQMHGRNVLSDDRETGCFDERCPFPHSQRADADVNFVG
jgi:hypothetical protein